MTFSLLLYGIDSGYVEVALRRLHVHGYILYSNPRGDEHPGTSPVGEAVGDLKTNLPVQSFNHVVERVFCADARASSSRETRGRYVDRP